MITTTETLTAALADFGGNAIIDGVSTNTIAILFTANPTSVGGDMMEQMGPTGVVDAATATAKGVDKSSELTIDGADYAVRAIDPDGLGGWVLALEVI